MARTKMEQYVFEKRQSGMNDKQIATSLGMSLKHFYKELGDKKAEIKTENKPITSKPTGPEKKPESKPEPKHETVQKVPEKPVESEKMASESKTEEDLSWME